MTVYRYPLKSVIGDYVRAAAGLIIALGLLLTGALPLFVAVLFGALTLLFSLFALRTLKRQYLEVSLNDQGVATLMRPGSQEDSKGRFPRYLAWQELTEVKLRYYGSRRSHTKEGGGGFMQLTLSGHAASPSGGREQKTTMSFESSLEGFPAIVRQAADAARRKQVTIDATTAGNLLPLGIDIDADATEGLET